MTICELLGGSKLAAAGVGGAPPGLAPNLEGSRLAVTNPQMVKTNKPTMAHNTV